MGMALPGVGHLDAVDLTLHCHNVRSIAFCGSTLVTAADDEVAQWLLGCSRLSKNKIGDFLGMSHADAVGILDVFFNALQLRELTFDEALRFINTLFRLPGEAQQIARILECFAAKYAAAHPETLGSADTAYVPSHASYSKLQFKKCCCYVGTLMMRFPNHY